MIVALAFLFNQMNQLINHFLRITIKHIDIIPCKQAILYT